ncbi:MAG: K+/H+ antiporter [Bacteroidetes bacterium GWF2_41_61]|nr:MAG: K+/H+ antiporter [Bacteroidetes bacterium GWE2_40_15]OFY31476.1 MAG: K+/H+ antiporter [Bacteroidetes bacterium GWF2_41_61]OFY88195.1 MAG: K+/H+ antiporter [Bacteroidetes bacterium RIFOXYA12_FULL_40_10]HBG24826.1 potassium/proton antiporter [Rikenellaceae bacterium]HBZ25083.1 potassium/proton antiporter [Rikenellaceae bacterium]
MNITSENILLIGSVLLFVSIIAGKAGNRFGVPALVLFLGVGMLFGSDGLGIEFNSPYIAQFIGVAALSVILFSGGMDTNISEIKPVLWQGVVLASVGVILNTLITGLIIFYISHFFSRFISFTIAESMLLASIISSTDSASVFSILRSKKIVLKNNLKPLLELESGSNDPMAFMLTIIFLKMTQSSDVGVLTFVTNLLTQFGIGAICGYIIARSALYFIRKINFESKSLYHILLLAALFFTYSFTDFLNGNGFLAVYIAGLTIGNSKIQCDPTAYSFFDSVAWLGQLILFLTLGLLVSPKELIQFDVAGIGVIVAFSMIIISRPFAVFLSLMPFKGMGIKSRHFISWVGLRGAVPIVFATYPLIAGIENAYHIFNIVFFITIVSLLVQGTTVGFAAKKLGLTDNKESA